MVGVDVGLGQAASEAGDFPAQSVVARRGSPTQADSRQEGAGTAQRAPLNLPERFLSLTLSLAYSTRVQVR